MENLEREKIEDHLGRSFKTLRVSLTNSCNLACTYCVSDKADSKTNYVPLLKKLSLNEYLLAINKIYELTGIHTIRLTGGEPLLFKDIGSLVKGIKEIGIQNIRMTSNGFLLSELASNLKGEGLNSINVSLDAVDEETFFKMSKRKNVSKIIDGIDKALELGMEVKLNCVVMKGVNEDQIIPLLDFAGQRRISIRFLELMNMGHINESHSHYFYSQEEILKNISSKYKTFSIERETSATANYWITDNLIKFGVISNISHPFCSDCNRLRLDSYGRIFGCLSSNAGISVMNSLDNNHDLEELLKKALYQKQSVFTGSSISMKAIGG